MKVAIPHDAERSQLIIAIELLEALNQAKGGAEQLCFHRRDPRFLLIRDGLEATHKLCQAMFPMGVQRGEREKKIILVK